MHRRSKDTQTDEVPSQFVVVVGIISPARETTYIPGLRFKFVSLALQVASRRNGFMAIRRCTSCVRRGAADCHRNYL